MATAAIPLIVAGIGAAASAGTAMYSASEQRAAQERSIKAQKEMYAQNQPPAVLNQPPPPITQGPAGGDMMNLPGTNISPVLSGGGFKDVKESPSGGLQVGDPNQKKNLGGGMTIGV